MYNFSQQCTLFSSNSFNAWKSLIETARLKTFCVPSKRTGDTLNSFSDGKPVSIQHPYEEFAKYKLGFPGILKR